MQIKIRVMEYQGVGIYQIQPSDGRLAYYVSDPIYGQVCKGDTVGDVVADITRNHAMGDRRIKVMEYRGVGIYQVSNDGQIYYVSDPVYGQAITGNTVGNVVAEITGKQAMGGRF